MTATTSPSVVYTTLEVRISSLLVTIAHFKRTAGISPLVLTISQDFPLRVGFYDLTALVHFASGGGISALFFYTFEAGGYIVPNVRGFLYM